MLYDVLTRLSGDTGLHAVQKRDTLLQILREGAKKLYQILECDDIYREVTLVVPQNKVVSLPYFVSSLRAMRIHTSDIPFELHSLTQPRYIEHTWKYKWKNWRNMGNSPVHSTPQTQNNITFEVNAVEATPVTIYVSGQSNLSDRIEESILINETLINSVNIFGPRIDVIACFSPRIYDITIKILDQEIAKLFSTRNSTQYKIVDVSELPWPQDTAAGDSLIDVLYKQPLEFLTRNTDKFPAGDEYDDAWYHFSMHSFLKPIQNRQEEAQSHYGEGVASATSTKSSIEDVEQKKINFGRNKFYDLFENPSIEIPHGGDCCR